MRYPIENPADWRKFGSLSFRERYLALAWRSWRHRLRARRWKQVDLTAVSPSRGSLAACDLILICVVRNAEKYLPSLLAHYRSIGISRFAVVDDRSDDGTRALLGGETDVDLYQSSVDFRRSAGGLLWRDGLVDIYGRDRWYVSIDADEYLVYPGFEERRLPDFITDLERNGLKRALAVMLDIYPDRAIGAVGKTLESFPTEVSPLYDSAGYEIRNDKLCTAIRGGPRFRVFGTDMRMTKFPVVFADRQTRFTSGSHHALLPLQRNFSAVQAVLLHHKFPAGAVQDFHAITARGSHFGGSAFYKQTIAHPSFGDELDFRYPGSARYEGSETLVEQGFMQDLRLK